MTKTKIVEKKKDMAKTGGGPPIFDNKVDEEVADLIIPAEVEGHNVPEPNIIFEIIDANQSFDHLEVKMIKNYTYFEVTLPITLW